MTCEVNNKEINSQCAELLVRPLYNVQCTLYSLHYEYDAIVISISK